MYAEETVVYADVLFFINFAVDFLCLCLSAFLLRRQLRPRRVCLAALWGALYSFFPYFVLLKPWALLICHLSAAALTVFIAAGGRNKKAFLSFFGSFFITECLAGGAVTGIKNLLAATGKEPSPRGMTAAVLVAAAAALGYALLFRKSTGRSSVFLKIVCRDVCVTAHLLVDSGNLVSEPFSALPVIFVSSAVFPYPMDTPDPRKYPVPLRAIPFRTASGEGVLFGFLPDEIKLLNGKKHKKLTEAYIAVDTLSSGFSGYDGLMPACLL